MRLDRAVFLAAELGKEARVPRALQGYLPQGEMISGIAERGLVGYAASENLDIENVMAYKQRGADGGSAVDVMEFKHLLAGAIKEELQFRAEDLRPSEFYRLTDEVNRWLSNSVQGIIDSEELDLSVPVDHEIEYLRTGFEPLDLLIGGPQTPGIFPGLYVVMGHPGTGKTSHFFRMMERLRAMTEHPSGVDHMDAQSLWMYQLEIPKVLIGPRIKPMQRRVKFRPGQDLIKCGPFSMNDIITENEENPDPSRVVFIDSPDVMAGGVDEGRRFALGAIYRDLIRLKRHVRAVFVASQPRRDDEQLTMQSVSESYEKAHYADAVIGIMRPKVDTMEKSSFTPFVMRTLKSRFSADGKKVLYEFDLGDFEDRLIKKKETDEAEDSGGW